MFDRYHDTLLAGGDSDRTIQAYVGAVRIYGSFVDPRRLVDGRLDDVRDFQLARARAGLSPVSLRVFYYALRRLYNQALLRGWDFTSVPLPRPVRSLPNVPTRDEVAALIAAASTIRVRTAMVLAFGCGLRTSEICGLRIEDILSAQGIIFVHHGKGGYDRWVPLPDKVLGELRDCWRRVRGSVYLLEGPRPGQRIDPSGLQRGFQAARRTAGITRGLRLHSLRHAYATGLLESGENLRRIQARLGHQSLAATERYTHLAPDWLRHRKSPIDDLELRPFKGPSKE